MFTVGVLTGGQNPRTALGFGGDDGSPSADLLLAASGSAEYIMQSDPREQATSRRRLLQAAGIGLALSLGGCVGSGGGASEPTGGDDSGAGTGGTPTETGNPMPTGTDEPSGGTSLTGSCGAAFGDTDSPYEAASSQWVVTFAYPTGGEVFFAGSAGEEIGAAIGYEPDFDGGYAHELTVTQEDGATVTAEKLAEENGRESGEPVAYGGRQHPVAVRSTPDSVTMVFVVEGDEENHGIVVGANPGIAEACPDVYAAICRRVLESVAPRE
jgi:hypothetical protein